MEVIPFHFFLAVLADLMKSCLVGAPLLPTGLIFSFEPALMRSCLALILAYRPGFVAMTDSSGGLYGVYVMWVFWFVKGVVFYGKKLLGVSNVCIC